MTVTLTKGGQVHDQPKHSPRWQGLTHTGKVNDAGVSIPGEPIIINCHNHVDTGICADCAADLVRVLGDVPRLLDDLDIAIAGESRFVEHGVRNGHSDSTASGRHPAIAAQNRLTQALIGDGTQAHPGIRDWFDNYGPANLAPALARNLSAVQLEPRMPTLARNLSQAASRAHKVIDMPVDLCYYGPCPEGHDIWQERIHRDDAETPVRCRCGYTSPLFDHQKRLLTGGEDRWLTVGELVSAITMGGEVVTRDQIKGWIERDGLARERRVRPRYVNGELVTSEVWTYRLGDVRDRAARGDQRKKANAS